MLWCIPGLWQTALAWPGHQPSPDFRRQDTETPGGFWETYVTTQIKLPCLRDLFFFSPFKTVPILLGGKKIHLNITKEKPRVQISPPEWKTTAPLAGKAIFQTQPSESGHDLPIIFKFIFVERWSKSRLECFLQLLLLAVSWSLEFHFLGQDHFCMIFFQRFIVYSPWKSLFWVTQKWPYWVHTCPWKKYIH